MGRGRLPLLLLSLSRRHRRHGTVAQAGAGVEQPHRLLAGARQGSRSRSAGAARRLLLLLSLLLLARRVAAVAIIIIVAAALRLAARIVHSLSLPGELLLAAPKGGLLLLLLLLLPQQLLPQQLLLQQVAIGASKQLQGDAGVDVGG